MLDISDFRLSPLSSRFKSVAVEDKFQRAELANNITFGRWTLSVALVLTLAQAYDAFVPWEDAFESALKNLFFCLEVIVLTVLLLAWWRISSIREPRTWQLVSMGLLLAVSVQFFLHQTFSPNQLPGLSFVLVSLYTLFIYLFITASLHWVLLLALTFSMAVYFGSRHQSVSTGEALPLLPAVLVLLLVNGVGAWIHRHRQHGLRTLFIARELLKEKAEQEARMVVGQQEFITILAHEVSNPLAIIQAKCQLANLQSDRQLSLDVNIHADILAMVARIQSVFDALMSNEQALTHPQTLNIIDLPLHNWLTTTAEIGHWDMTHTAVISPHNALAVTRCDPGLLQLIVNNLCSNAVKFSPSGRPLALAVRVRGSEVGIRVRDYGPGIAKEWQDLIFQKYTRRVPNTGLKGYGFGLFLVKSLTQRMNGRITLQSVEGRGSAFTVWLPRGVKP